MSGANIQSSVARTYLQGVFALLNVDFNQHSYRESPASLGTYHTAYSSHANNLHWISNASGSSKGKLLLPKLLFKS